MHLQEWYDSISSYCFLWGGYWINYENISMYWLLFPPLNPIIFHPLADLSLLCMCYFSIYLHSGWVKVEKILKDSLDSIPSPSHSVKIQIMGGKVCLRCKGKTLLGVVDKLLKTKSLLTSPSNVLPYYLK